MYKVIMSLKSLLSALWSNPIFRIVLLMLLYIIVAYIAVYFVSSKYLFSAFNVLY